jgi:hypothetical protein
MADAPLPTCADPYGYYTQVTVNLATAGLAASGGGTLSELGALNPLENAATASTELQSERLQTVGSGKL